MWSSILSISANSGPFRALLLTVLGPRAISILVEPQGALTCRSSTITVWADSGPFLGLYLVLGSRSDFHDCRTSGCVYMWSSTLSITANSGPFRTLLLTVLGPGVISTIDEPLGAFTCRSSLILGLSDSGLFHGLLLNVLGSQNAFHGCRIPRCDMCWSSTLVVWVCSGPFLGLYLVFGSRSDFHDC